MIAAHKSENPAATGFNATNQRTDTCESTPDQKELATIIARLAIAGHSVHKGRERDYIVCKWGMSRWCADFAALQEFARVLGVKSC